MLTDGRKVMVAQMFMEIWNLLRSAEIDGFADVDRYANAASHTSTYAKGAPFGGFG